MGALNLLAIEEFEAVQERFHILNSATTRFTRSKQTLEETITEMDEEVTTRFKTTFDAIVLNLSAHSQDYLVVDVQHLN